MTGLRPSRTLETARRSSVSGHSFSARQVRYWWRATPRLSGHVGGSGTSFTVKQEPSTPVDNRTGAYRSIPSDIGRHPVPGALDFPFARIQVVAATPTRLTRMDGFTQQHLIKRGYASCDASIRSHLDPTIAPPPAFPYPAAQVSRFSLGRRGFARRQPSRSPVRYRPTADGRAGGTGR